MGCLTRAPSPGSGVTDNKVARLPCLSKRAQMEGVNPEKMAEEKKKGVGNIRVSRRRSGKSGPLHPSFVIGDQSDKADREDDNERRGGNL